MATHPGLQRQVMNVYAALEREHRRVSALAIGHRAYLELGKQRRSDPR